jgi:hypothetical protein
MRYVAERRNLDESIEELRQIADGRNDILAEAAGITAGPRGDRNSGRHLALAPRDDLVRVVGVAVRRTAGARRRTQTGIGVSSVAATTARVAA